jgi:magnesium-transporting ATPase (P-type)
MCVQVAFIISAATWAGLLGWYFNDIAKYGWKDEKWQRPGETEWNKSSLAQLVHDFVTVVTLVVVAVPDGLPLATTLSLVFSMLNLIKRNNFVRNLAASETMGQVTCICSDKTGTLTQNKMTVTRVWYCKKVIPVDGAAASAFTADWKDLAQDVVQANSTAIVTVEKDGSVVVTGSKTEGALFKFLEAIGIKGSRKYEKSKEVPFTSDRKRMTTVIKTATGYRVFVKGAPEWILPLCKDVYSGTGTTVPASDELKAEITKNITEFASLGLRTILGAYCDITELDPDAPPEELEKGLTAICVFGIEDPVRPEVPGAIRTCQNAGVTVR